MALTIKSMENSLQLKFKIGETGEGKDITRTKTFNKIKPTILDEALNEVALALVELQENELISIIRNTPVLYEEV